MVSLHHLHKTALQGVKSRVDFVSFQEVCELSSSRHSVSIKMGSILPGFVKDSKRGEQDSDPTVLLNFDAKGSRFHSGDQENAFRCKVFVSEEIN